MDKINRNFRPPSPSNQKWQIEVTRFGLRAASPLISGKKGETKTLGQICLEYVTIKYIIVTSNLEEFRIFDQERRT